MSEHKIDEYFKKHLQGVEEPILPGDFSEFEKLARKKRSVKWLFLILLLPLIGVSAYFIFNSYSNGIDPNTSSHTKEESRKSESISTKNQLSENPITSESENEQTTSTSSSDTVMGALEQFSSTAHSEKNGTTSILSTGINEEIAADDSNTENQNSGKEKSNSNNLQIFETTTAASLTKNTSRKTTPTIIAKNPEVTHPKNSNDKFEKDSDTSSAKSKSNTDEAIEGNVTLSRNPETATLPNLDFEKITPLGLSEIEISNTPQLNSNAEMTIIPALKTWGVDAFAQFEMNNELGAVPSAGFISSWQIKKWNIGFGLGIGQTGTLNWKQTREEISYGFDVYEENYVLNTKNFTFLSLPIHLAYRVLPRSEVFIGLTPQMIVNASQAYENSESNQNQTTGYLYTTGAPSLLLFLNLGYGFSITEGLKLDLGINYAPQKWNVTEKNPLGGFFRLKYNIK